MVNITSQQIINLRAKDPSIIASDMARIIGRSRERIRQLLVQLQMETDVRYTKWKFCIQCDSRVSQGATICQKCITQNGWVIVICQTCNIFIKRRTSYVKRTYTSHRYKGNIFCTQKCFKVFIKGKGRGSTNDKNSM